MPIDLSPRAMNSYTVNINASSKLAFNIAKALLIFTVWGSAMIFGLYILAFYALSFFNGQLTQWNKILPGLYDPGDTSATIGIGIHFMAGGLILILGCFQMLDILRRRYPQVHRWSGRLYVFASIFAAIGGLSFIFIKGTVGGWVMDIGFGLYGILMFVAAVETIRYARLKEFEKHRSWAIRLFALAIGSWLYRMDYGFWFSITNGYGHTADFHGPFDRIMSFFFYMPNLLIAEVIIARFEFFKTPIIQYINAFLLFICSAFLLFASYYFIRQLWGPAIMEAFF